LLITVFYLNRILLMVQYVCLKCGKQFNKKSNYDYHTQKRQTLCNKNIIKKKYPCQFCKSNFTTKSNLSRHIKKFCKIDNEYESKNMLSYGYRGSNENLEHEINSIDTIKEIKRLDTDVKKISRKIDKLIEILNN